MPAVGGLISGILVFTWAPEAEGHGTDAMIRAFHRGGGHDSKPRPGDQDDRIDHHDRHRRIGGPGRADCTDRRRLWIVACANLESSRRRIDGCLMLAGAAGGVGAIFRAPLGGALFAGEVLYSSTAFESAALLPCLASSIVAYSTFAIFITPKPIFSLPIMSFRGLRELPLFVVLTLVCAAVGWLYVHVFYGMRDRFFKPMPIPKHLKPAVGGLLLGIVGPGVSASHGRRLWVGAMGSDRHAAIVHCTGRPEFCAAHGHEHSFDAGPAENCRDRADHQLRRQRWCVWPVDVDRWHAGWRLRSVLRTWLPDAHIEPAAFVLVGMGGFFAGVSKTPLTSIVMVSEMTGSYSLLVPVDAGLRA